MEYIKKEDLKDGNIFVAQLSHNHFMNKMGTGYSLHLKTDNTIKVKVLYKGGGFSYDNIRLATPEEKHWLEECIKLDKFITLEETMKSFIPEYVECIKQLIGSIYKLGMIYKVNDNGFIKNDSYSFAHYNYNQDRFKPSTKEAYDAQFVVKEPEFVLPYAWYVIVDKENLDILSNWIFPNGFKLTIGGIAGVCNYGGKIGNKGHNLTKIIKGYRYDFGVEITFEQFKKYVLKEETPVQDFMKLHDEIVMKNYPPGPRRSALMDINIIDKEIIKPLPQFKIIETIETITKVENNEGNQFFIGDTVKSLYSDQKGTITKFRYSADKSNIIAITTFQSNNSIGIDKIEHYIEPKVEIEPEFILPEKWCIKRDSENDKIVTDYINKIASMPHSYLPRNLYNPYLHNNTNGCCSYHSIREDYTEITFDQFKKYILKEEVKEETLLEKAKRLYPIGTKFKSATTCKLFTVKDHNELHSNLGKNICFNTIEQNEAGNYYGCIHSVQGDWAEIVE